MTRWLSDHEKHTGNALYELYAVVVHLGSGLVPISIPRVGVANEA